MTLKGIVKKRLRKENRMYLINRNIEKIAVKKSVKTSVTNKTVKDKGVPKYDGSGRGLRLNRGRGGCDPAKDIGLRKKIIN